MSRNRTSYDNIQLMIIFVILCFLLFFCVKNFEKPKKGYTLVNYKSQKY